MELSPIGEPMQIKSKIKQMSMVMCSSNDADCHKVVVRSNNELVKYLWDAWSEKLRMHEYSWQKFLKILKLMTGDIILWAIKDVITWNELLGRISSILKAYGER
jgi:hypothetical protein